ncbi:BnaA01g18830D [Brassica napus]|uniref:BnaA01g18830D protein n=1 Tax=Brassica napus TaxID=3708 RepID=A0A078G949_BRANA|nr:BnaA01g18830D [Brassica napus]
MAMAQIELSDGRGGDGEDGEARRTKVEPSLALYHTFYRC